MTVSLVARRHGVAPNQLFTWRRTRWAVLRRLLGKKTLEAESSNTPRKQKNGSNADRRNGLAGRRCQRREDRRNCENRKRAAAPLGPAEPPEAWPLPPPPGLPESTFDNWRLQNRRILKDL